MSNGDNDITPPKYSICITHFNNGSTLADSLSSIMDQINDEFEIVVVDNCSNDESVQTLDRLKQDGKIRLIRKRCSRGRGRQIAFENSQGRYVISNLDMDEIYRNNLLDVVKFYHSQCEGYLLLVVAGVEKKMRGLQNITIGPRDLISKLGGWRDLQYSEDWDLWSRAAMIDRYFWTSYNLLESPNQHQEREDLLPRLRLRYIRYRESMRLNRRSFFDEEKMSLSQLVIKLLARWSLIFHESYNNGFNMEFSSYDTKYFRSFMS